MARARAFSGWTKAKEPPKGPAGVLFLTMPTQTLVALPTVPVQVMPCGIWTLTVKSVLVAVERPATMPGTFCVIWAVWKALASVPPEEGSILAVRGPAPSWLI